MAHFDVMADTIDRRVTRSRSNELRRAQGMATKSSSNPSMNAAREQPGGVDQIQGEQDRQPLVATDGVADSAYGRNTSEEMYRCMNTLAPDSGPLEQPQESIPRETPREDSEELFRNWMATQIGLQNQTSRQPPNDASYGSFQLGDPPPNIAQVPRSQQDESQWQLILDNLQPGTFTQNPFLSEDAAPKDSNSQKQRNIMAKEKGRGLPPTRFGPNKEASRDYPLTRSRSSGTEKNQPIQSEGIGGSLNSSLNPTIPAATPLSVGDVGNEGDQTNNTDSNFMRSQAPKDSTVSLGAPGNHNQHAQQQQFDLRPESLSIELSKLRNSLSKANRRSKADKQSQDGRKQTQQQSKNNEQPQAKGKSSPAISNRQQDESTYRAKDLREQLESDGGLMQMGPLVPDSQALVHSPTTSSAAALSQPTSDGPSTSGMAQSRKRAANGEILENGSGSADAPQKSELLARANSITSTQKQGFPVIQLDGATKKRRDERQRKMKGRGRSNAPSMPEDLQAALKRCDKLEKEVRSLKLNLSFMNRKDSEQTKQIEELVQENNELKSQKKGLIEQLEQISAMPQRDFVGGKRVAVGSW